jgi:hypothetical protein
MPALRTPAPATFFRVYARGGATARMTPFSLLLRRLDSSRVVVAERGAGGGSWRAILRGEAGWVAVSLGVACCGRQELDGLL